MLCDLKKLMSVQSSDQMNTFNSKKIARWGWNAWCNLQHNCESLTRSRTPHSKVFSSPSTNLYTSNSAYLFVNWWIKKNIVHPRYLLNVYSKLSFDNFLFKVKRYYYTLLLGHLTGVIGLCATNWSRTD